MSQASITVQYTPFALALEVARDGTITAALRRVADPPAAPALVFASVEHLDRVEIGTNSAGPVLWIGSTAFAVPRRQLARIGAWLEGQRAPVVELKTQSSESPIRQLHQGEVYTLGPEPPETEA